MIRHCVFSRFQPSASAALRGEIYAEIAALKARLPGFVAAQIGSNVSPETGMDKGYSEGFIVDFVDAAARDVYLTDPEHQKTGAKIVAAAEGGLDGILVFDLSVPD